MSGLDLSRAIAMESRSDAGRVRRNNEDAVLTDPALGLAVLADGMGGHNAGEVASNMAITALGSELAHAFRQQPLEVGAAGPAGRVRTVLLDIIIRTNAAIHMAAKSNPRFSGMGTTLVAVQFYDNRLAVAHIGDSRLYRLRSHALEQLTRDHSLLQEQIDQGLIAPELARFAPHRNLVTRALGVDSTVQTELAEHAVEPGDLYLLCSDGLTDMVEDAEIAAVLDAATDNLPQCAAQLLEKANTHGGRDNVSVILARIREPFPLARSPARAGRGSPVLRA